MTRAQLIQLIRERSSYLCVGLDPDPEKFPSELLEAADPIFEFNQAMIDATRDLCVAYKINTAFYESQGLSGWKALQRTASYIGQDHLVIADAKRGDIGNTSSQYAKAFFEQMDFDGVTVAPYMGRDSVQPFLDYPGKWTIVLGLTSNPGSADFELQPSGDELLYEKVMRTVSTWGKPDNLMFVVGATQAESFANIRRLLPEHFFLVPGVGAQGGSLREISEAAMNADIGILVNVSRGILYASAAPALDEASGVGSAGSGTLAAFAEAARGAAQGYQQEMKGYLDKILQVKIYG